MQCVELRIEKIIHYKIIAQKCPFILNFVIKSHKKNKQIIETVNEHTHVSLVLQMPNKHLRRYLSPSVVKSQLFLLLCPCCNPNLPKINKIPTFKNGYITLFENKNFFL